jgi:hypothetical protein
VLHHVLMRELKAGRGGRAEVTAGRRGRLQSRGGEGDRLEEGEDPTGGPHLSVRGERGGEKWAARKLDGSGEGAGRRPGWATWAEKKRGKSRAGLETGKGKVRRFCFLFFKPFFKTFLNLF